MKKEEKLALKIDDAISNFGTDMDYFVGFRNGLRFAKSLIDEKPPKYENVKEKYNVLRKWQELKVLLSNWIGGISPPSKREEVTMIETLKGVIEAMEQLEERK